MTKPDPGALRQLDTELMTCRRCLDAGFDIAEGAIFSHPAASDVMLIGQAPGVTEVEAQRPFNAGSGRRLFQWLEQAGWQEDYFRANCVMTAVTKCYPGKASNGKGDRVPGKQEQHFCRSFLEREIGLYQPHLIIPVGGLAIKHFFPAHLKLNEAIGTAAYHDKESAVVPTIFDLQRARWLDTFDSDFDHDGCWIVPLPHPSGASLWPNKAENKALINRATEILGEARLTLGL